MPMMIEPDEDSADSSIQRNHLALSSRLHSLRSRPSLQMRWGVLAAVCIAMTGSYYSIDIPSALHQQIKNYMPQTSSFEYNFNLLYTLYSLPNIVLPFIGGNLVDRYSAPVCFVVFALCTFIGQIVFAVGTSYKNWHVMLLGRILYGLGGENICVAQSALLAAWFAGKELALALGICLSLSRLGSVFNNLVSPALANSSSMPTAAYFGAVVNCCSVIMTVATLFLDIKGAKKCERSNDATAKLTMSLLEDRDDIDDDNIPSERDIMEHNNNATVSLKEIRNFGPLFWLLSLSCLVVYGCVIPFNNVASGILLERNYFTTDSASVSNSSCTALLYPDQCTLGTLQKKNVNYPIDNRNDKNKCQLKEYAAPLLPSSVNITWSEKLWFHERYVLRDITIKDVNCVDPFWAEACTKNYCDAQKEATELAGKIMSIPYFISVGISPILGYMVDRFGFRAALATLAPLCLVAVHIAMALGSSESSPVVPLIGQGVAYALFASVIWPSVPLTVEERLTGTAFGVITGIQNIGLTVFPIIVATIFHNSGDRFIPGVEFLFVACALVGVVAGIFLNLIDFKSGGHLNYTKTTKNEEIVKGEQERSGYIATLVPSSDSAYI